MAPAKLTPQPIIIQSENDAFDFLKRALASEFEDDHRTLDFQHWPVLTIRLTGEGYDSTITSDMAESLVELQHAMNRTYARALKGRGKATLLTNEQRQEIKFKAKVEKGSSFISVQMGDFANSLTTALVGKMDGTQQLVTAVLLVIAAAGVISFKDFLKHRSEDKKVELETQARIAMSAEDTKKMTVMGQAMQAVQSSQQGRQIAIALEDFDDVRHTIVKSVGDAKSISVQGIDLTQAEAKTIASTPRLRAEDIQLNGNYTIQKIDWSKEHEVTISVFRTSDSLQFTARLNISTLSAEQKSMLKDSEWNRAHLHLQINATRLRGEITTATIVGVDFPKPVEAKPVDPT